MNPLVSINILNFDRLHKLSYTLPSLIETAGYDNYELSITDNGSTDGSVAYLVNQFETVKEIKRLILLPKNYGEGRGAAVGMEHAKGEILIHSCNDLKYTRFGWVAETARIINEYPEIVCYAPVVTKEYGAIKEINENGLYFKICNGIPAFCVAITRENYDALGGFKDCGGAMGAKMLRYGQAGMEYKYADDVRNLADKLKVGHTGCALPFQANSAATHDWEQRGKRMDENNKGEWVKEPPEVLKKIKIMEK